MVHDPALLDRLERLDPVTVHAVLWRHMFNRLDPQLANVRGARWNPRGTAAVYLSFKRETALAEAEHSLAVQPVRPRPKSRQLYRMEVTLTRVVDLSTPGLLEDLGVTPTDRQHPPPTRCTEIGGACAWLGCEALVVPSARAAGTNLVVFTDTMAPDAALEVVETIELDA